MRRGRRVRGGRRRADGVAARPFVLLVQPTIADPSRAPEGKHVAWAYCHVPNGSTADLTDAIEAQVERFAPGFRDCILARATKDAAGDGGVRRQLRRRRHQRRHRRLAAAAVPAGRALEPVLDLGPGDLPVLVVDATRRRRPRHGRRARGPQPPTGGWVADDRGRGRRHPTRVAPSACGRCSPRRSPCRWCSRRPCCPTPAARCSCCPTASRASSSRVRRPRQPIAWLLLLMAIGLRARDRARHRVARGSPRRDRRSARASSPRGRTGRAGCSSSPASSGSRSCFPADRFRPDRWGRGRPAAHRDDHPRGDPARRRPRDERDGARPSVRRRRPQPICPAVPRRGAGGARAQHRCSGWCSSSRHSLPGCRWSRGSGSRAGQERLQYRWLASALAARRLRRASRGRS